MKLKEIKEINYKGWILMTIYIMELKHGLCGYFPLIEKKLQKVVFCKNRDDLKTIWEGLPKKQVSISEIECVVNEEDKLAIPVNGPRGDDADSDSFYLILDNLDEYLSGSPIEERFSYAPGLLSLVDESNAVFPENNV
jgi:hypothetical protein